jgi:hypothetical protein
VSEWKEGWPSVAEVDALPINAQVELACTSVYGGRAVVPVAAEYLVDRRDELEHTAYPAVRYELAVTFLESGQLRDRYEWRIRPA